MKRLTVLIAGCSLFLTTGCGLVGYYAPVMPPSGLFFSSVQAPIDIDADPTTFGMKAGQSSAFSVLGLFAFGDASVASAARDGNLTTIHHLDYDYLNVLFIFQRFTTTAYGE